MYRGAGWCVRVRAFDWFFWACGAGWWQMRVGARRLACGRFWHTPMSRRNRSASPHRRLHLAVAVRNPFGFRSNSVRITFKFHRPAIRHPLQSMCVVLRKCTRSAAGADLPHMRFRFRTSNPISNFSNYSNCRNCSYCMRFRFRISNPIRLHLAMAVRIPSPLPSSFRPLFSHPPSSPTLHPPFALFAPAPVHIPGA